MHSWLKSISAFLSALLFSACAKGLGANPDGATGEFAMRSYFVSGFSSLRQVDYSVDDQLNLRVTRQIRLELEPFAFGVNDSDRANQEQKCEGEPDQACGRPKLKPLRSGKYTLRFAIVRNGYEDAARADQLLSAGEKVVEVTDGRLVVDIPLSVRELRLMGSRNHLLIELSAPDSIFSLKPVIFESALDGNLSARLMFAPFDIKKLEPALRTQIDEFKPMLGDLSPDLDTRISGLSSVVRLMGVVRGLEDARERKLKANFIASQNLIDWPSTLANYAQVTRGGMLRALASGKADFNLYNSLCSTWMYRVFPELEKEMVGAGAGVYDGPSFMDSCTGSREPGATRFAFVRRLGLKYQPFFVFQNIVVVDAAKFKAIQPPGRNFSIQIGERFYVRARTEYNYEAGLRPLSWIPIVGPYLSLAGMLSIDKSLKEDSGNEMRFTSNMQVSVEENTMILELSSYKRCLIVRMNPDWIDNFQLRPFFEAAKSELRRDQLRRAMAERGLIVCQPPETRPITKQEKYFYLSSAKDGGLLQDPTDLRNKQVALSLRGDRDFQAFVSAGKSKLDWADSTWNDYSGINSWLGGVDDAVSAVVPAAPGVYVDSVFY